MYRGSLLYLYFVIGSTTLLIIERVGSFVNGSITAVAGSGMRSMSLACIGCHPLIDEPSKPNPSSKELSSNCGVGKDVCCHIPGKSINFKSSIFALFFFANSKTSFGVINPPFKLKPFKPFKLFEPIKLSPPYLYWIKLGKEFK